MSKKKESIDQYFIETAIAFGDYTKHKGCYLIKRPGNNYILYIPDSITEAPSKLFSEPEYDGYRFQVAGGKNLTIADWMFSDCKAKSIDLSYLDTSNVETMRFMFSGCKAKSINLSSLDTSKVTDMDYMFAYSTIESLDLRSFDVSNVTSMANMFVLCKAECIDLTSFKIPRNIIELDTFKVSSSPSMYDMFKFCNSHIKVTDSKILEKYNHRIK